MEHSFKIGVVGHGFVGKAVAHGFQNCDLTIADPLLGTSTQDILRANPSVVFICVPTPMGDDGIIDASIVEKVLTELEPLQTLMVLKSTVIPDIVKKLSARFRHFVYNPEFLTERNAEHDFEYPQLHVFGGHQEDTHYLAKIYREYSICNPCPEHHMTAVEASFVKYGINSFLSTKISFWNQYEQLCSANGADYDTVRRAIGEDVRIGASHMMVPGHDGRRGFGSACFSKDVPALIHFSDKHLSILREAWNVNVDIRNQYSELLEREVAQNISFKKI